MRDLRESCRIAGGQAAPVMFDKAACTVKAVELIRAAAAERAELIVFPELFIPGYPYGMTFGFTVGSRTAGRTGAVLRHQLHPGAWAGDEILGRAAPGGSGLREYRRVRAGRRQRHAVQYQPDLFPGGRTAHRPPEAVAPPARSGWCGVTRTGITSRWRRRPGVPWPA